MEADSRQYLRRNKLLKGLSDEQVRRVTRLVRPEAFPTDAVVVRQAEAPLRVYLLAEGRVQVRRSLPGYEESAVAELDPGDFFGEMAVIIDSAVHSASVIALSPLKTFSLSSTDFTRLLGEYPEMTQNILSNIILQLQSQNQRWLESLRVEKEVLELKVRERTHELEKVGQRVGRELVLAQSIQRNLLPDKRKSFPGIEVASEYIPCDELGGDITGVFQVDESRLAVYGGDVCGHGVYAAMVMSYVKKLIETSVKRVLLNRQYIVKPPGAVLSAINQSFIREISQGDPEIYLTLFLGILDMNHLTLEHASAGIHVPPLTISGGAAAPLFDQSEFPIGHVPDHEYSTQRSTFSPGDTFLFVSDGVIEAQRGDEAFGMGRLKKEALGAKTGTAPLDLDALVLSVRTFLGDHPPLDDMCLLTISFASSNAAAG
jgi:sigma-B regulation protein RsbU (phosphoserine phosphatase)